MPGSSAMKKASSRLGRGLRRLSKSSGAKTSKLPIKAGMNLARESVPPPYIKNKRDVERM